MGIERHCHLLIIIQTRVKPALSIRREDDNLGRVKNHRAVRERKKREGGRGRQLGEDAPVLPFPVASCGQVEQRHCAALSLHICGLRNGFC